MEIGVSEIHCYVYLHSQHAPVCSQLSIVFVRSIITIAMLYGFCYGALKVMNHSTFLLSFFLDFSCICMDAGLFCVEHIKYSSEYSVCFRTRGILNTFLCFSQCFVGCWLLFHTISAAKAVTPLFSCKSFCECVGLCF